MNKLEKFFNVLSSSSPRLLKEYTTQELISQIKEYVDFTPYIVKNIYKLLISQDADDRKNGAIILKSIMFQFKLKVNFKIEYVDKKEEYLSSTGEEYETKKLSLSEQKKLVKKMAGLEYVDANIITEIDFKPDNGVTIKKNKVKDKPIENVNDFFENLSNNLLNYEWNKRHGAFLAYCSMFEEEHNGQIEIIVDTLLFTKIYEILKSDKFTDFVDDRAVAPVREAAAQLLGCIYPKISKNNIIEELVKFLDDCDWQAQYSGLLAIHNLKAYVLDKKGLCVKLQNLLTSQDEDVKLLAAELILYFYDYCDKNKVFDVCIQNLKDRDEISISKVSIISLLAKYHTKIDDVSIFYEYFTSPIPEVRKSVLNLARFLEDNSLNFLYAELILLDDKAEISDQAAEILKNRKLQTNFINHFMSILDNSLYEPYNKDEFVSYDELYFTTSGVKTLGKNVILKNRVKLFKVLLCNINEEVVLHNSKTLIGDVFARIYNQKKQLGDELHKKIKTSGVTLLCLKSNYKKYKDLDIVPLKELEKKFTTPEYTSLHPLGDCVYVDFTRWVAVLEYPDLTENVVNLFKYETCAEYLDFFSDMLVSDFDAKYVNLDFFIESAYHCLVEYDNFAIFFRCFGIRLFKHKFYESILLDKQKNLFFEKTIFFYTNVLDQLENIYCYALENDYTEILRGFLCSINFTEKFIERTLSIMNLTNLSLLVKDIDHSFYPILVKPLLNLITSVEHHEKASSIISYIIPRLNFRINSEISSQWKNKLVIAKNELECIFDNSKIKEYVIKCPVNAKLRKYQIDGVKWINFLYTFNLNGILADDMGLGKTLQVLSFLCSEMYKTDRKTLIICPSSLTGHWKSEIDNFFVDFKSVLHKKYKDEDYDFLIVSYDSFRNEHTKFVEKDWFYIILDEGHVLRNPATMLYQRIKKIKCRRKLILTGTPVHNSVEDIVSLFDLLMPNYLSAKSIPNMNARMSDKELRDVHERLEVLNKQVLPFILRRLKVDVLVDLPPKIIRDINVEMNSVQRAIYQNIEESVHAKTENIDYKSVQKRGEALVRTKDLLNAASHTGYFQQTTELSCKMKGLIDIINLYGGDDIKNKILIFFQYKSTIDFVIQDFNKKFKLKYFRLDGSVPPSKRSKVASDFNTGNVPIMFLTTLIGGLGLNLTGADTVIFYEHDWNPFNDLQAMDRAHRIGQKNTVNVFRLIAKDSIEEKVMNLQSFKVFIASSIITQQNADIETMNTNDLLERFGK